MIVVNCVNYGIALMTIYKSVSAGCEKYIFHSRLESLGGKKNYSSKL